MSPPVVYESDAIKSALSLPVEERRKLVTKISIQQGSWAALQTSAVWLPTMAYLHYGKSGPAKFFQTSLNMSAKTAVTIMPILFAWGMVAEQVATRLANPQMFEHEADHGFVSTLPLHKRVANYVYDNPIRSLIMMGVPGVIAIFASKGGQNELSMSQRIMHTRVAGQFSVLALLVGTIGFHDYMHRVNGGRFLEPWEEELKKKHEALVAAEEAAQKH